MFEPCACLGAFNEGITCEENVFLNDAEEGCNVDKGFEAGSILCANCRPGYSRDGAAGCKPCYKGELKLFFPILVALLILLLLLFFIWSTVIKRGGAFRVSDGAKKIFVSFLQLAALASTMNIPWPEGYFELFKMKSMVSSVGEEYIDIRCTLPEPASIAQVQYIKTLGYALTPVVLVLLSVVGWCICGRKYPAEKRKAMRTGTIVLVLYFVWPAITSRAFFNCGNVTTMETGLVLSFLSTRRQNAPIVCHLLWRNLLGVPSVIVYIVGLPAAAMLALYNHRNRLDDALTQIRFGMLYDGFSRKNYLHEFWVAMRKLLIIWIGIFTDKLQVLLAIGVVGMLLVHTVMVQPFKTSLTILEIMLLSCCFVTLWIGGVFVVYPQCQSPDASVYTMCIIGEGFILFINFFCFLVGFCVYVWLAWMERREQLVGRSKKLCAQLASWRLFQPCCKKGIGLWLRSSQVEWADNPLDATQVDIEMTKTRKKESVLEEMARSVSESKLKQCQMEIKALKEKNKELQMRLDTFKNLKGNSSMRKRIQTVGKLGVANPEYNTTIVISQLMNDQ